MSENINMVDALHKTIYKQDQLIAELKKQLEEKDKKIAELEEITDSVVSTAYYKLARTDEIIKLKAQLKSQPAEIVEKIGGEIYTRMVVECKETKYTDINLILDTILKEYQK